MRLDDGHTILYARGSVDFFRTCPGLYVPNPLLLHAQRRDTPDWNLLLKETLALTKMNWNGTQFDGASPFTLKAERQVTSSNTCRKARRQTQDTASTCKRRTLNGQPSGGAAPFCDVGCTEARRSLPPDPKRIAGPVYLLGPADPQNSSPHLSGL
jgi:hypothetical protein